MDPGYFAGNLTFNFLALRQVARGLQGILVMVGRCTQAWTRCNWLIIFRVSSTPPTHLLCLVDRRSQPHRVLFCRPLNSCTAHAYPPTGIGHPLLAFLHFGQYSCCASRHFLRELLSRFESFFLARGFFMAERTSVESLHLCVFHSVLLQPVKLTSCSFLLFVSYLSEGYTQLIFVTMRAPHRSSATFLMSDGSSEILSDTSSSSAFFLWSHNNRSCALPLFGAQLL